MIFKDLFYPNFHNLQLIVLDFMSNILHNLFAQQLLPKIIIYY